MRWIEEERRRVKGAWMLGVWWGVYGHAATPVWGCGFQA